FCDTDRAGAIEPVRNGERIGARERAAAVVCAASDVDDEIVVSVRADRGGGVACKLAVEGPVLVEQRTVEEARGGWEVGIGSKGGGGTRHDSRFFSARLSLARRGGRGAVCELYRPFWL